jgi:kynureninase
MNESPRQPEAFLHDTSAQLAPHYTRFRVSQRILLTGHSHQAWPDVSFEAQQQAWLDAAEQVDDKWGRAAEIAVLVRAGWRRLLNDPAGHITLGQNTHELIVRWLSAVMPMFGAAPASSRFAIVTTDGEFHTVRRQMDRLAEAGVEVVKVAARPVDTLADRMAAQVTDRTAAVLVSSVLFETAEIVPGLPILAERCRFVGTPLLVDAYHHLNVVWFDLSRLLLDDAFIVGGGYKYCQSGEGNCFLRVPPSCELRPVLTGWFSHFEALGDRQPEGKVAYGMGADRFAGATYDPTAHYRAAAVFAFHQEQHLSPDVLRVISQRQTMRLESAFRSLDLDPGVADLIEVPPGRRAGFVAIRSPHAARLVAAMRTRGVFADARAEILRLGPAPYLSDTQLADGIAVLGEAAREL